MKSLEPHRTTSCTACGDALAPDQLLGLPCDCAYCRDCLTRLFTRALDDETLFPPRCHRKTIDPAKARPFLTPALMRSFRAKALEVGTKNRIYCSNLQDCNAFVAPHSIHNGQAYCQKCGQITCVKCKKNEHWGPCGQNEGRQALFDLAKTEEWKACPNCKRLVEKVDGCNHIWCRCDTEFCYECGLVTRQCECVVEEEDFDREDHARELFQLARIMVERLRRTGAPLSGESVEDIIEDTLVAPFGLGEFED